MPAYDWQGRSGPPWSPTVTATVTGHGEAVPCSKVTSPLLPGSSHDGEAVAVFALRLRRLPAKPRRQAAVAQVRVSESASQRATGRTGPRQWSVALLTGGTREAAQKLGRVGRPTERLASVAPAPSSPRSVLAGAGPSRSQDGVQCLVPWRLPGSGDADIAKGVGERGGGRTALCTVGICKFGGSVIGSNEPITTCFPPK